LEDQAEMRLFKQAMKDTGESKGGPEDQRQQVRKLKDDHKEQARMSELKDAQKMLVIDGRFNMNKELGTGKLELIDEMRSQLSYIENEESSLSLFQKDKQ
jgi:hypothetical protein